MPPTSDATTPSASTCLFTGEVLTASTRFEHTIPRSVGGRVRSRTVSSDRFNKAAGNKVDKKLAEASASVMKRVRKNASTLATLTLPGDAGIAIDLDLFDINAEIAAIKSILLTADHLLSADPNRFTRSAALSPVRNLVRDYVLKGRFDADVYNRSVLGIQYAKLDELVRLRQSIEKSISEFEHVMVISANPSVRTIDASWWLASVNPHGFRLSSSWLGERFTLMIVSSFLESSDTSIHWITPAFRCELTELERARRDFYTTRQQFQAMNRKIINQHRDG